MKEALQHETTTQRIGLSPTGPRNHRSNGPNASHALTFKLDHSGGADQQDKIFDRRLELYRGVISKVYEALGDFRSADFWFDMGGQEDTEGKRYVGLATQAIGTATNLLAQGRLFASDSFVTAFEKLMDTQSEGYELGDYFGETLVRVKTMPDFLKELERVAIKEITSEVA